MENGDLVDLHLQPGGFHGAVRGWHRSPGESLVSPDTA